MKIGICSGLVIRPKRLALGLSEERMCPPSRYRQCFNKGLAHCIEMVCLPHAGRQLGCVLSAVRKDDQLPIGVVARRRDTAEQRICQYLCDPLEACPLSPDW